jgi:hypothetical protein
MAAINYFVVCNAPNFGSPGPEDIGRFSLPMRLRAKRFPLTVLGLSAVPLSLSHLPETGSMPSKIELMPHDTPPMRRGEF